MTKEYKLLIYPNEFLTQKVEEISLDNWDDSDGDLSEIANDMSIHGITRRNWSSS